MEPLHYWLLQVDDVDTLAKWWRSNIEELWNRGAIAFRKVPLQRKEDDTMLVPSGPPTGPPRPIACPEAVPKGSEFALQYHDGVEWKTGHISSLSDPASLRGSSKRWSILRQATDEETELGSMILGMELRIAENLRHRPDESLPSGWARFFKSADSPIDLDDLADVFAAGVAYGRAQAMECYSNGTPDISKLRRSQLGEVAEAALLRHGVELEPLDLLSAMGGERATEDAKYVWVFPSGRKIDQTEFRKGVNAAKTALARRKAAEI